MALSKTIGRLALVLTLAGGPVAADGLAGAYLAARSASIAGDFEAAAQYFSMALTRDPGNPELMESLVIAHLALGQVDRALPVARTLQSSGVASQVARMALMAEKAAKQDYEAILAEVVETRGIGPLVDGLLQAWALIGQGNMSDALVAFDAVADERGLRGFALYHKALALASVGDFEGAEALFSGEDGISIQAARRGSIARLQVLSQLEQNDKALELLDTNFSGDLDPELKAIQVRLAAGELLPFDVVRTPKEGMAEVFFTVAAALHNEADDDYTLLYTRIAEYLRPDHIDAILLTAGLLERLGHYNLAVDTLKKVPKDSTAFHAAELGRAESLRRAGKVDAAIEVLEQLTRSHTELPIVHTTLGDVLRQQERFEEAIVAYDMAVDLYKEMGEQQWFVHYARAICHERLDQWEQAEADFRKALELNPDQPQVLNYLGYSLVEQRVKLDEALELIERAVAARPDSGYIVDSLGWVLYRLGRYDEAVIHMERAVELMAVDPIVNDHLGDVLWAVGRKLEAQFQWKRALSFVTEDTPLDELNPDRIRRKLEVGLDQVLVEEGADPLKVANGDE